MSLGGPEVLIVLLILLAPAVGIWAIVDAAIRPTEAFDRLQQSKLVWILVLAITAVLCGPLGLVPSIYYLAGVRPKLLAT
jgi:hypothetical protein